MLITKLTKNNITILKTNAIDELEDALYAKYKGVWIAGKDYKNKTLLKYKDAIYEINIPPYVKLYDKTQNYKEGDVVKLIDNNKIMYFKAVKDIPSYLPYNNPYKDEKEIHCITGAREINSTSWRYKRRIENFPENNTWYCSGVGASPSYKYFVYKNGTNWHLKTYIRRNFRGNWEEQSDEVIKIGTIADQNTKYFTYDGDFYERNIYYDGTPKRVDIYDSNYWESLDILDSFYYSTLNKDKIFDNNINSKAQMEDYIYYKIKVNAKKIYLYGIIGDRLEVVVNGNKVITEDILYSTKGVTRFINMQTKKEHIVEIKIYAPKKIAAIGDIYIENSETIDVGITDFNVSFSSYDTSKIEKKPGGVVDIKKGIIFKKADVTVFNYANKRRFLLELIESIGSERCAFDFEDVELKDQNEICGQEISIIGRVVSSSMQLKNKDNNLDDIAPMKFTIEEYA